MCCVQVVVCASSTAVHGLCVHVQQQQQPAGRCCFLLLLPGSQLILRLTPALQCFRATSKLWFGVCKAVAWWQGLPGACIEQIEVGNSAGLEAGTSYPVFWRNLKDSQRNLKHNKISKLDFWWKEWPNINKQHSTNRLIGCLISFIFYIFSQILTCFWSV